jgi:hypothetical protein
MGQFYESLVSTAQLEHQRQKYQTQFTQEGEHWLDLDTYAMYLNLLYYIDDFRV